MRENTFVHEMKKLVKNRWVLARWMRTPMGTAECRRGMGRGGGLCRDGLRQGRPGKTIQLHGMEIPRKRQ